jgi:hypothetical protein
MGMKISKGHIAFLAGLVLYLFLIDTHPCFADFESSLIDIKTKVTTVILPLVAVIGMAFAAISFFTGNPQAKQHIFYAILGCIFGFGAQAIVDLISQTVH